MLCNPPNTRSTSPRFAAAYFASVGRCSSAEYLVCIILLMSLACGVAGLWAGCGHNTLAAKLFFWLCVAVQMLRHALVVSWSAMGRQLGGVPISITGIYALGQFFDVYSIKVFDY